MREHFKNIVLANFIIYVIWFLIPYVDINLSQDEYDALSWSGLGAIYEGSVYIDYAFFLIYGITTLGLIYFKYWSRPLFLIVSISDFVFSSISGVAVILPVDGTVGYLLTLTDGAILYMLYFTKISQKFNKRVQKD